MTQTIEQLTARIAELERSLWARDRDCDAKNLMISSLEEDNARLQALMDFDNERLYQIENELEEVEYLGPYVEGIKVLKTQLAAAQLQVKTLRDWVFTNSMHADDCDVLSLDENGLHCACSCGLTEALSALASTEALDTYLKGN